MTVAALKPRGNTTTRHVADVMLEARDLSHWFAPGRGLSSTTFSHQGPGCLAVMGPNGSGKSTLLRIIAGLIRPGGGRFELAVGGRELPRSGRREAIGYAAPSLAFYEVLTVGENLMFAAEARRLDRPAACVRECLHRVGLEDRGADRVAGLSTGMTQRLR